MFDSLSYPHNGIHLDIPTTSSGPINGVTGDVYALYQHADVHGPHCYSLFALVVRSPEGWMAVAVKDGFHDLDLFPDMDGALREARAWLASSRAHAKKQALENLAHLVRLIGQNKSPNPGMRTVEDNNALAGRPLHSQHGTQNTPGWATKVGGASAAHRLSAFAA